MPLQSELSAIVPREAAVRLTTTNVLPTATPDPSDREGAEADETRGGSESPVDERAVVAASLAIAIEDCDLETFRACGAECRCRAQARGIIAEQGMS
jgi:hypothetical protein